MSQWIVPKVTTTERMTITPAEGEILFDETENKYYGGNGSTVGGIEISSDETNVSIDGTTVSNPNLIFNNNIDATISGSDVTINAAGGSGGSGNIALFESSGATGNTIDSTAIVTNINAPPTLVQNIVLGERYLSTPGSDFSYSNTTGIFTFASDKFYLMFLENITTSVRMSYTSTGLGNQEYRGNFTFRLIKTSLGIDETLLSFTSTGNVNVPQNGSSSLIPGSISPLMDEDIIEIKNGDILRLEVTCVITRTAGSGDSANELSSNFVETSPKAKFLFYSIAGTGSGSSPLPTFYRNTGTPSGGFSTTTGIKIIYTLGNQITDSIYTGSSGEDTTVSEAGRYNISLVGNYSDNGDSGNAAIIMEISRLLAGSSLSTTLVQTSDSFTSTGTFNGKSLSVATVVDLDANDSIRITGRKATAADVTVGFGGSLSIIKIG